MKDVTKSLFFTVLKLQKIEVLKLQKIEFMKRFYKQLFYSFKTPKKLLMGTAISYFRILLPLPLPLFEKAHFFSFKTKEKNGKKWKRNVILVMFSKPLFMQFWYSQKTRFQNGNYACVLKPQITTTKGRCCMHKWFFGRFETDAYYEFWYIVPLFGTIMP